MAVLLSRGALPAAAAALPLVLRGVFTLLALQLLFVRLSSGAKGDPRAALVSSVEWVDACAELVDFHCPEAPKASDPAVLWNCVVDHRRDATASEACATAVLQSELELSKQGLFVDPVVCQTSAAILRCGSRDADCLVDAMQKIADVSCQQQVRRYVREFSDVYEIAGPALKDACGADRAALCKNADDKEGGVHQCLQAHYARLSSDCKDRVIAIARLWAEDVSLDIPTQVSCAADIANLCSSEEKVGGMVQNCLQKASRQAARRERAQQAGGPGAGGGVVSSACRNSLRTTQRLHSKMGGDISVFPLVRRSCESELARLCKPGTESLGCLIQNLPRIKEPSCSQALREFARVQPEELPALDGVDLHVCVKDQALLCTDVAKGAQDSDANSNPMIQACLKENYGKLEDNACKSEIHKLMVLQHETLDFNPLASDCAAELEGVCADAAGRKDPSNGVNTGFGPVLCLVRHRDDVDTVSDTCRKAIIEYEVEEREGFSLLPAKVQDACSALVEVACVPAVREEGSHAAAREVDGLRLACLRNLFSHDDPRFQHAKNKECYRGLTELIAEEALDLNVDRRKRDACSSDVQRLCAEVPYQGGRLNQCLFDHVDKLSTACNRVMTQLMHEEIMALDVLPVVQDACHTQLRQYCRDVEPGEGRLFECLVKKRTGKAFDNRCQAALFSQQVLASEDVRFNAPLYKSCQESIPRLCADALPADGWRWMNDDNSVASAGDSTNDGSDTGGLADLHGKVLNCLIRRRDQITSFAREPGNRRQEAKFAQATQCRSHVAEAMKQIASDLRLNPELHESCFDDQKYFCASIKPGMGSVHACLRAHLNLLKPECRRGEFEEMEIEASDFDLKLQLKQACAYEVGAFCKGVSHKKLTHCLQDHTSAMGMSEDCREMILSDEVFEFRYSSLNPELRTACADDPVANSCGLGSSEAQLSAYACLKDSIDNIKLDACKVEVQRIMEKQAEDIRLDPEVSTACLDDQVDLCKGVPPGHGRIHDCLQRNFKYLDSRCFEEEFSEAVRGALASNLQMKRTLKDACEAELRTLCRQFKAGPVQLACLVDLPSTQKSADCRDELSAYQRQVAEYSQLDTQLQSSCRREIPNFCTDAVKGVDQTLTGAKKAAAVSEATIECLQASRLTMSHQSDCREYLLQKLIEAGKDIQLDRQLFKACRADLEDFCPQANDAKVPGSSHECLRDHVDELSIECRVHESARQKLEVHDVRLNGYISFQCDAALTQFCGGVQVEDRLRCLLKAQSSAGSGAEGPKNVESGETFTPGCREALKKTEIRAAEDQQLQPVLEEECAADVARLCRSEHDADVGKEQFGLRSSTVVSCLVRSLGAIHDFACKSRVKDLVQERAADIRLAPSVKESCLEDMRELCPTVDPSHGRMHMCLRRHFDDLSDACRQAEFQEIRVELRSEFLVNPTIKAGCSRELEEFCTPSSGHNMVEGSSGESGGGGGQKAVLSEEQALACLRRISRASRRGEALRGSASADFEDNSAKATLSSECAAAVGQFDSARRQDVRLQPSFFKECKKDLTSVCGEVLVNAFTGPGAQKGKEKASLAWATFALGKMSTEGKVLGKNVTEQLQQCLIYNVQTITPGCIEELDDMADAFLINLIHRPGYAQACNSDDHTVLCSTASQAQHPLQSGNHQRRRQQWHDSRECAVYDLPSWGGGNAQRQAADARHSGALPAVGGAVGSILDGGLFQRGSKWTRYNLTKTCAKFLIKEKKAADTAVETFHQFSSALKMLTDLKKNKRLQDQMLERFGSADSSRESFLVISGWFAIVAGLTLVAFIAVVVAMVYWRFQHQVQDSVGAVASAVTGTRQVMSDKGS